MVVVIDTPRGADGEGGRQLAGLATGQAASDCVAMYTLGCSWMLPSSTRPSLNRTAVVPTMTLVNHTWSHPTSTGRRPRVSLIRFAATPGSSPENETTVISNAAKAFGPQEVVLAHANLPTITRCYAQQGGPKELLIGHRCEAIGLSGRRGMLCGHR